MQLAFVTYVKAPDLTLDDQLIAQYFKENGVEVSPMIWDDPAIEWNKFDFIILRSTWDYFERPLEFDQWLDSLQPIAHKVLNPLPVVKWNKNKHYFDELSQKGVLLPPYVICKSKNKYNLKSILEENNWIKAVVKPVISGGAYQTWITTVNSGINDQLKFEELLCSGDVIVQRFVEEIISNGELSLIFFNKKFSHAICKKAIQGDFRVQTQFGGTADPIIPDPIILQYASDLLNSIPEQLLYARVDGVVSNEVKFLLMELELIEPSLSVSTNPSACGNFYNALIEICS